MTTLKGLWQRIARFAQALEGVDDPHGEHMLSLGKRVEKLERDVAHLERRLDLRPGAGGMLQETVARTLFHQCRVLTAERRLHADAVCG